MEHVARAAKVAADIELALEESTLEQCERLRRCISEIVPLLQNLQAMKMPFGGGTVRAVNQLLEALEPMHRLVTDYEAHRLSEQMTVLRQLWQRQIELHLAVQFQKSFEQDMDASARKVWETKTFSVNAGNITPRL